MMSLYSYLYSYLCIQHVCMYICIYLSSLKTSILGTPKFKGWSSFYCNDHKLGVYPIFRQTHIVACQYLSISPVYPCYKTLCIK